MSSDNLGNGMLDIVVINEPEKIRAVMDPLRCWILRLLKKREMTIKELTDELRKILPREEAERVTPQKVNYHVKALEKLGLITVASERSVKGRPHMTVRIYRRRASRILITYSPDSEGDEGQDLDTILDLMERMGLAVKISDRKNLLDQLMGMISLIRGAYRDVLRFFEPNGYRSGDPLEPLNVYLLFLTLVQLIRKGEFGQFVERVSKLLNFMRGPPRPKDLSKKR